MTGAELKEWRLRLGLTQEQAGEALGRSRVWVWSIERYPDKEIEERMVALACARVEDIVRRAETKQCPCKIVGSGR